MVFFLRMTLFSFNLKFKRTKLYTSQSFSGELFAATKSTSRILVEVFKEKKQKSPKKTRNGVKTLKEIFRVFFVFVLLSLKKGHTTKNDTKYDEREKNSGNYANVILKRRAGSLLFANSIRRNWITMIVIEIWKCPNFLFFFSNYAPNIHFSIMMKFYWILGGAWRNIAVRVLASKFNEPNGFMTVIQTTKMSIHIIVLPVIWCHFLAFYCATGRFVPSVFDQQSSTKILHFDFECLY